MPAYLINYREEFDEPLREKIRAFRRSSKGTDYRGWYRIQKALMKARDERIYHWDMDKIPFSEIFDDDIDVMLGYYKNDPQAGQVRCLIENLKRNSDPRRGRGRMSVPRLKKIMFEILNARISEYLNPRDKMEKLKMMCIVGGSGCGKTLASLHLKYHKDANVICSFTTRPPRKTEVEGRDHHFIDIVPDFTDMIAYTYFGGHYYYALKTQVFGPCTVYVIDERGLDNLKRDFGDQYDIYTVFIKRKKILRKRCGVSKLRIDRDRIRLLDERDYDYVVENNSTKKAFFEQIERIYEEIKNK